MNRNGVVQMKLGYSKGVGDVRKITYPQIDKIGRLMRQYFNYHEPKASAWLKTNFRVNSVPDLATAQLGDQVIAVLNQMHEQLNARRARRRANREARRHLT